MAGFSHVNFKWNIVSADLKFLCLFQIRIIDKFFCFFVNAKMYLKKKFGNLNFMDKVSDRQSDRHLQSYLYWFIPAQN